MSITDIPIQWFSLGILAATVVQICLTIYQIRLIRKGQK